MILSAGADFTVDITGLGRVADFVEGFCHDSGVAPDLALKLVLVVEELATNALRHGCPASGHLHVALRLARSGDRLEICYEDDASPFDPTREAPPAVVEGDALHRPLGGLGVHLVRAFTDAQRYEYLNGRNRLVLEKAIQGEG